MSEKRMNAQTIFIKDLKKDVERVEFVRIALWKITFFKIRLNVIDEHLLDQEKMNLVIYKHLYTDPYLILKKDFGFTEDFQIKIKKNKKMISYYFIAQRTKEWPFGNPNLFASDWKYNYYIDEAGSKWRTKHWGHGQFNYELITWKED